MNTRLITLAALAVSATFGGAALAQPATTPVTAPVTFADIDTNADAMLTLEEIQAHYSNATQESFDQVDVDNNDSLNEEEFSALIPLLETSVTPPAGSGQGQSR